MINKHITDFLESKKGAVTEIKKYDSSIIENSIRVIISNLSSRGIFRSHIAKKIVFLEGVLTKENPGYVRVLTPHLYHNLCTLPATKEKEKREKKSLIKSIKNHIFDSKRDKMNVIVRYPYYWTQLV